MQSCFVQAFHDEIKHFSRSLTLHWLVWFFPFILFFLFTGIFSAGVLFDLPVGVIDQDKSSLSREVIRDMNASSRTQVINYDSQLSEAVADLSRVNIYSLMVIPPNFEADVLAAKQPSPLVYFNTVYYGAGLYSVTDFPSIFASINAQYRPTMATKFATPIPPLANVVLSYNGLFDANGNYVYYQQFSAIIHLLQLFVCTSCIYVLSRLPKTVVPTFRTLAGRLAPYTLLYTAIILAEIAVLVAMSDARMHGNPFWLILLGICYVIAAQSVGILLYSFTPNSVTAYSLIGVLVGIALTFSGVSIPELSMPKSAVFISRIEPLTYALNAMFDVFLRQVSALNMLKVSAILLLYPVVIGLLVRKRLFTRIQNGEAPL